MLLILWRNMIQCRCIFGSKKAFDTVNHHTLFKKLFSYGIRGTILKWFESYLTDRLQFVTFDGTQSEVKSAKMWCSTGINIRPTSIYHLYE